jgi:hypothetical protein
MVEVRKYSKRHFEIKYILPLAKGKNYQKEVSYYLFTPAKLNLNETTTSLDSLRHKFHSFGRYGSPELTFEMLLDNDNKISPLSIIDSYVEELKFKNEMSFSEREFVHETQAIVNVFHHRLKTLMASLLLYNKENDIESFKAIIKRFNKERSIVKEWFSETVDILLCLDNIDRVYATSVKWCDEAVSLTIDRYITDFYNQIKNSASKINAEADLLAILQDERERRINRGFERKYDNNEKVAFRRDSLNKWSKSVLTLNPIISKTPKRVNEAVAGFAASIAMAFAIVANLFIVSISDSLTIRFEIFVIVIYIFKDRIKEWVKRLFLKVQPRLIPDRICSYVSPRTLSTVCVSKDRLIYANFKKIDSSVIDVRKEQSENVFYSMMEEETVVKNSHYLNVKSVKLDKKRLPWISSFALVDRVRIDDWLKEMVDDLASLENDDPFISTPVYHLHLVVEEIDEDGKTEYSHFLIVINHTGILYVRAFEDEENIPFYKRRGEKLVFKSKKDKKQYEKDSKKKVKQDGKKNKKKSK